MEENPESSQARPAFRSLALGVGVTCFALAIACAVFGAVNQEDTSLYAAAACGSVGVVMLSIWRTGRLPPRP